MSVPAERLPCPPRLPTEDELPCDDGIPMETPRHRLQMDLLIHTLEPWAAKRRDVFVSGNQFLYFSADQLRGRDFRGPMFSSSAVSSGASARAGLFGKRAKARMSSSN